MTQEQLVDGVCALLREKVAPQLTLKKAQGQNYSAPIEWIHPSVYPAYAPGQTQAESLEAAPCMVVMPDTGSEGARDIMQKVRVAVYVWDPGILKEEPGTGRLYLVADRSKAWRGLSTAIELIRQEVLRTHIIAGAAVEYPLRFESRAVIRPRDVPGDAGESETNERALTESMAALSYPYAMGWVEIPMRYGAGRTQTDTLNEFIK